MNISGAEVKRGRAANHAVDVVLRRLASPRSAGARLDVDRRGGRVWGMKMANISVPKF